MLNFHFSEMVLGLVSPSCFVHDFSRKMLLMIHSISWPNFIVWLFLLLVIMGNMCIKIVCYPGYEVIKFQINLIFFIKPFRYMTKMSKQKLKCLENEKSFWAELKTCFIIFKELKVAKNCLTLESAPLMLLTSKLNACKYRKPMCFIPYYCCCRFVYCNICVSCFNISNSWCSI